MYKQLGRSLVQEQPPSLSTRMIRDHLDFDNTPLTPPFRKEEEGESAMLPSMGNEHDISWVSY